MCCSCGHLLNCFTQNVHIRLHPGFNKFLSSQLSHNCHHHHHCASGEAAIGTILAEGVLVNRQVRMRQVADKMCPHFF